MSNVVDFRPAADRPSDDQAPEFRAHYLKHRETVYVPVYALDDVLIVPAPTFHQRRQMRRRRIILASIALGSGLVGFAWGIRIIFALIVGQVP